ncbi:hypothetical protein KUH03_31105 [Sphingobacterium sp. E70]|uniref:hypothetical protein n=1 Tax=Sphingobacterium sp. E70 TaxID=2853439 RepID=UPI00211D0DB4|nr:hypothetical protein [Sphingobacterium sp. E70]ULT23585.1 hypothetical protein KUH03_31105 [Sphingobacterium sp. E70]
MAKIIGIDSGTVKDNDNHVGGAQYLLKDLDAAFWREAEKNAKSYLYSWKILMQGYGKEP